MAKKKHRRNQAQTRQYLLTAAFAALLALALIAASRVLPKVGSSETSSPYAVRISEIMAANPSACAAVDGRYYDYVELENIGDQAVNLAGWTLSDGSHLGEGYKLPKLILEPGARALVYCAGSESLPKGYLAANFKLNTGGETLLLTDAKTREADRVTYPPLGSAQVYARFEDGEWAESGLFTPGLPNTEEAHASLLRPDVSDSPIVISEVMPRNRSCLTAPDGSYCDWIELVNRSGEAVSLSGYALTDRDDLSRKFELPDRTVEAGGYFLIYAGDPAYETDGVFTGFALTEGETLRLVDRAGDTVSWVEIPSTEKDQSLAWNESSFRVTDNATPGYPNTAEGMQAFRASVVSTAVENPLGIYINEVLCQSSSTDDWVELVNLSSQEVDLSGFGLSDTVAKSRKWVFPEGARIPAGGYVLVVLHGSDAESPKEGLYVADFSLSMEGDEVLRLCDRDGNPLDSCSLASQRTDVSYGRVPGCDSFRYFTTPTPGTANAGESYGGITQRVGFSKEGGAVSGEAFDLTLSSEEGATIYYTLDGTCPTASSARYTAPVHVSGNCVVRAIASAGDKLPSDDQARTYLFGAEHPARLVCISGNASELTGSGGVLHEDRKSIRPYVCAEFYDENGALIDCQGCEMVLNGHQSNLLFDQKGFRLTAKSEYGDNRFRGKLFSNRDYTEYKSVLLRASGQDNEQTRMRDSILSALAADTSLMYQETEVCAVYVNAEYWGHYNLRERVNEQSIAQFEGWDDPASVQIVEGSGYHGTGGSELRAVISAAAKNGLQDDSNVELLRQYIDVENYLDYVAMELYTANQDLNNIRAYRSSEADNRWRWVVYDLDLGYQVDANSVSRWLTPGGVGSVTTQDNTLFIAMMKNDALRDYFLTRMGELLATTFSAENVSGRILERYQLLQPEMQLHSQRWGFGLSTWKRYSTAMYKYSIKRPGKLMGYFQSTLNLSDEDMQKYFGEALAADAAFQAKQ